MISVCIATYNGANFIVRQLDSVFMQLSPDDQVIVVDDLSTDDTVNIVKQTYGDRVEVHVNNQNLGPIKSFERALTMARGDIFFLCDQDDIWEKNKVKKVIKAFEDGKADLVVHDAFVVDGNLKMISSSWNEFNGNKMQQGIIGNVLKNAYTGAMMAFKKDLAPLILPFPPSIEMHDQWIAIVSMLEKKKIIYIEEPLMKYVRHGANVTGMRKRSISAKLKGRVGTIRAILNSRR